MDTHGSTSGRAGRDGDGGADQAGPRRTERVPGRQGDPPQDQVPGAGAGAGAGAANPSVELTVSQRTYLAAEAGPQDLHAILTVAVRGLPDTAAGPAGAHPGPHPGAHPGPHSGPRSGPGSGLAEVLVVDCSASMNHPERKMHAARQAAVAALRALPDGTPFAVVRGTQFAATVYPPSGPMRPASARTRAEATRAVYAMQPTGGTCVGNWLDLAGTLLAEQAAPIPHVLMLTDGKNEHDDHNPLAGVLDTWEGRFLCDAWGIGRDWDARVLIDVTRRLHGSADAVHEESELPAAYTALVADLLARPLPELEIRVTPSPGATLRWLRQTFPHELALPQRQMGSAVAFTTRAWGNQVRRFQLCLTVDPAGRALDEDLQAAAVAVALPAGPERYGRAAQVALPPAVACEVRWTADPVLAAAENEEDEHFEKYRRLGETAAQAAEAFRLDRDDEVLRLLGVAVALAHELGAQRQLAELQRIVEIRDPAAGHVVLRKGVTADAFEHLVTASTHTTHGPTTDGLPPGAVPVVPVAGLVDCAQCRAPMPSNARFCPKCRHPHVPGAGAR
ncbi:VWA domain-containing protein [Streptomyces sp. CA2R106]|uniref:VWA domain-containing protein n=1 Tax=Streptomyces sp. CA2R106 TaxID=3120153 RepID=UPI00300BE662